MLLELQGVVGLGRREGERERERRCTFIFYLE